MGQLVNERSIITPYRRHREGCQPPISHPAYESNIRRSPKKPLVLLPHTLSEITGPLYGHDAIQESDNDLTRQHPGEPLGERVIVSGRVIDCNGRPIPDALLEIWQANSAGRYAHLRDQHAAPLDPNFTGFGRTMTDENGAYRFVSIKPGAYPWLNHYNAWRPAHIHISIFGRAFITRLVTQMYFPGDPLHELDPVFMAVPDARARQRLVSRFDLEITQPNFALGYKFDIVLRGPEATPFEK